MISMKELAEDLARRDPMYKAALGGLWLYWARDPLRKTNHRRNDLLDHMNSLDPRFTTEQDRYIRDLEAKGFCTFFDNQYFTNEYKWIPEMFSHFFPGLPEQTISMVKHHSDLCQLYAGRHRFFPHYLAYEAWYLLSKEKRWVTEKEIETIADAYVAGFFAWNGMEHTLVLKRVKNGVNEFRTALDYHEVKDKVVVSDIQRNFALRMMDAMWLAYEYFEYYYIMENI